MEYKALYFDIGWVDSEKTGTTKQDPININPRCLKEGREHKEDFFFCSYDCTVEGGERWIG